MSRRPATAEDTERVSENTVQKQSKTVVARRQFIGKVVSNKMQKTVVVQIERRVQHPVYKKILKRTTRIKADTNDQEINVGQNVKIEQTRPISRGKHFKVTEVIEEKGGK